MSVLPFVLNRAMLSSSQYIIQLNICCSLNHRFSLNVLGKLFHCSSVVDSKRIHLVEPGASAPWAASRPLKISNFAASQAYNDPFMSHFSCSWRIAWFYWSCHMPQYFFDQHRSYLHSQPRNLVLIASLRSNHPPPRAMWDAHLLFRLCLFPRSCEWNPWSRTTIRFLTLD